MDDKSRQFVALHAGHKNVLAFIVEKINDIQLRIVAHGLRRDVHVRPTSHDDPIYAHERRVPLRIFTVEKLVSTQSQNTPDT